VPTTLSTSAALATYQRAMSPGHEAQPVAFEEVREVLTQLMSEGVALRVGPWQHESVGVHLKLMVAHLWRAFLVWVCPVAWRLTREDPRRRTRSIAEGTEILTDEEGVPDAHSLSKRWLIMPVGTWKEKWDLTILGCIVYSSIAAPVRVCFDAPSEGAVWVFEVAMALIFMLDVVFTFNTVCSLPSPICSLACPGNTQPCGCSASRSARYTLTQGRVTGLPRAGGLR
jgi:hypothetical protein